MLCLAVGDRALADHGVVIARLALPFLVRPVGGLAEDRNLSDPVRIEAERPLPAVVGVDVAEAEVERIFVIERHHPTRDSRARHAFLLLGGVAAARKLP